MADDNVKSTVIRKARVSFVKDNIQNIIHYETDADCVKNLNTAIVNGVTNVFNNDDTIRDIITNIALGGADLKSYAKLDSPSFIGEPKAPTPITSDNSLKIANTEFVNNKIAEIKGNTVDRNDLNNYVSKTGNDTITGLKTFNTDINTSNTSTIYWKIGNITVASINKTNYTGTSDKAVKDQNGNIINSTYATKTELNTKQNTLTFDTTPKAGSTNPVTSGGIYNAIKASGSISGNSLAVVAKTGSYTDLINTPSLATDSSLGFTKLYSSSGSRSDGTITQAGITELLSYKLDRENLAPIALSGEWSDIYNVPVANDTTKGITKLYSTSGTNTDGAISQYGINNILANYAKLTDITSAYRYKGTVDNYSDLPTSHKVGDVYNIKKANAANNIKAGDNVVWNGTEWDNLSGVVDLSAYLTKAESDSKYIPLQIDNKTTVTNNNTLIFNQANTTTDTIQLVQGSSSIYYEGYLNPTGAIFTYNPRSKEKKSYGIGSAGISYSNSSDTYWITVNPNSGIIQFRKVAANGDITKTVAMVEDLSKVATSGSYTDLSNKPTSLPANGGNASTVNGHTVNIDVPANAKFTDTVYTHPSTHPASMITGLATVATSGNYNDLINKPNIPESATVDSELSSTSTNAIQNKVVKAELDKKANIESPTFTGTATTNNLTVTGSLNIPGGKIWIE